MCSLDHDNSTLASLVPPTSTIHVIGSEWSNRVISLSEDGRKGSGNEYSASNIVRSVTSLLLRLGKTLQVRGLQWYHNDAYQICSTVHTDAVIIWKTWYKYPIFGGPRYCLSSTVIGTRMQRSINLSVLWNKTIYNCMTEGYGLLFDCRKGLAICLFELLLHIRRHSNMCLPDRYELVSKNTIRQIGGTLYSMLNSPEREATGMN